VLLAISRSDYCLSISDLARALKQSRQATQRMALDLAQAGWIEHRPNVDDRRLLQLFLTPQGKTAVHLIRRHFDSSALTCTSHVDSRSVRTSIDLLRSLRTSMAALHPVLKKPVPLRTISVAARSDVD
jgi:DNA-binding MarR family transcriptional regulator